MQHPVLLVILLVSLGFCATGLTILEPPELKAALGSLPSPALTQFLTNFTTIDAIHLILPKDLPARPTNSCVYFLPSAGISPDFGIKALWRKGAKCVVALSILGPGGTGRYFRDKSDDISQVQIPVVEIGDDIGGVLTTWLNNGTQIVISINSTDENPYDTTFYGPVGTSSIIIISVPAIINILLAIWKIQAHIRVYGCKPTIAQVVIWIDISANLLRLWFGLVSMAFRNQVLFLLTTLAASLSWPLNIITLLLVGVKWHEITQKSQMQSTLFLSSNRRPFLLISLVLFLVELIAGVLRGAYFSITLLTAISWSVQVVATIVVVIMLWIFGARVLRWMQKVQSSGSVDPSDSNIKSMRRVTIGLMSAGGAMFFVAIVFIVTFLISVLTSNNTSSVVLSILVLTGLNAASMIQMLSFPTPSMDNKKTLATGIASSSSKSSEKFGLVSRKISTLIWTSRKHVEYSEAIQPWVARFHGIESASYNIHRSSAFSQQKTIAEWLSKSCSTLKSIGVHLSTLDVLQSDFPEAFEQMSKGVSRVTLHGSLSGLNRTRLTPFSNVTSLTCADSYLNADNSAVITIAQVMTKLTRLGLGPTRLSAEQLKEIGKMERLTHLGFADFEDFHLPSFAPYRYNLEQQRDWNPNRIVGYLPDILKVMPAHIGINFFVFWGGSYRPFVELATANVNLAVTEQIVMAGAKLDMLDFSGENTVFMYTVSSSNGQSLASRPLVQYALEKNLVDTGLLITKYDCVQSLFLEIVENIRDPPPGFLENVFTVQLEKARKLHPENEQFFLRNSQRHTIAMRAARSIPASGETFHYIFSIGKRLGFSALDVDIEHATIAHHSIRQYSSNPTEIIANLIALKNLGVDLNARNYDGLKIFHLTSADRTDAIIAAAHDLGITVDFQDICTGGNNASLPMLSSACRNNNATSVRALLEVAIPASLLGDVKGFAPLHAACAAVNAQRAKDNVAALLEQRERLQLDLDPLLLTTSVWSWLPSPACGSGVTPLMIAVAYNYNDAALLLINAGAAINPVHPTKSNLFHYACERGNITVLDALCAKLTDADRHLVVDVNRSEFTPLLYLGWKLGMYGFETAKVEQMAETLLVAAGPLAAELVNVLDSRGRTVLFYAQRRRADSFCQLLLRFGAKEVSIE